MIDWTQESAKREIDRITEFIRAYVEDDETVVVPISGGIDSDVVARLCYKSLGAKRVKLFIVIQSDMEEKFVKNARNLAKDLGMALTEIHLETMNVDLIKALEDGEGSRGLFRSSILLDPAKAKCSVRAAVISSYQDKGYLIAGTTNRTEKEFGLFMTFGDNLAHIKPVAHLYKTELRKLAVYLGTSREVIEQASSAGFWCGQTDLEDMAYWIYNKGPIVNPRKYSDEEVKKVEKIKGTLTEKEIDRALELYFHGVETEEIKKGSKLPAEIVDGLICVVEKSKKLRNRKLLFEMQRQGV